MSTRQRTAGLAVVFLLVGLVAWWVVTGPEVPVPDTAAPRATQAAPRVVAGAHGGAPDGASLARAPLAAPDLPLEIDGVNEHGELPRGGCDLTLKWFAGDDTTGHPVREEVVHAGAQGRFTWRGPRSDGVTTVQLASNRADVRVFSVPVVILPEEGHALLPFTAVHLGCRLRGSVADPAGRPIAGARIDLNGWGTTRTGRDGRFALPAPRGSWSRTLHAHAEGFASASVQTLISADAEDEAVEVVLQPGVAFTGRVIDGEGAPVADAVVRTSASCIPARSDATGAFVLHGAAAGEHHRLVARKPGFAPGYASAVAGRGAAEIVLGRGHALDLRVIDEAGRGVVGARVRIDDNGYRHLGFTRAEGRFRLVDLPRGVVTVIVTRRGYRLEKQEVRVDGSDHERVVHLASRPGGSAVVRGRVVDAHGAPVAGAQIAYGRGGTSDDEGRFEVRGLRPGPYTVSAYKPGFARGRARCVAGGGEEVTLRLERAPTLAGRVRDAATGAPIRAFVLRISEDPRAARVPGRWFSHVVRCTDTDGIWRVAHWQIAADVRLFVQVDAPGYAPARAVVWPAVDPDPDATVFDLYRGISVRGVVRGRGSGAPLDGVAVELFSGDGSRPVDRVFRRVSRKTTTDAAGRFAVADVPAGPVRLRLVRRDLPTTSFGPIDVGVGPGTVEVHPTVGTGARLVGRLVGFAAAAGRTVEVTKGRTRRVAVRDDMTFEVAGLEPGTYVLTLRERGGVERWMRIEVGARDVEGIEFRAHAGTGELHGVVHGLDSGYVILSPLDGPDRAARQAGQRFPFTQGRFEARGLAPGRYRVSVAPETMQDWKQVAEVDIGDVVVTITVEAVR